MTNIVYWEQRSKEDTKGRGGFHWVCERFHHRPHTRSHLDIISHFIISHSKATKISNNYKCVQYDHLVGQYQRGAEGGGVETVGVKPAEVLHLSIVKIRIQVIHSHLFDQINHLSGFLQSHVHLLWQWGREKVEEERSLTSHSDETELPRRARELVWMTESDVVSTYFMEYMSCCKILILDMNINETLENGKKCMNVKVNAYLWHSICKHTWKKTGEAGDNVTANFLDFPPNFRLKTRF